MKLRRPNHRPCHLVVNVSFSLLLLLLCIQYDWLEHDALSEDDVAVGRRLSRLHQCKRLRGLLVEGESLHGKKVQLCLGRVVDDGAEFIPDRDLEVRKKTFGAVKIVF